MNDFEKQLQTARELAKTGSLVALPPPPEPQWLWFPQAAETKFSNGEGFGESPIRKLLGRFDSSRKTYERLF